MSKETNNDVSQFQKIISNFVIKKYVFILIKLPKLKNCISPN